MVVHWTPPQSPPPSLSFLGTPSSLPSLFTPRLTPRLHPHPPQSLCKLAVEPGQAEAIFSSSTAEQKLAEGHMCAAESKGVSRQCAVNKGKVSSRRWDTERLCAVLGRCMWVRLPEEGHKMPGRTFPAINAWVENKRSHVNEHIHRRPAHRPFLLTDTHSSQLQPFCSDGWAELIKVGAWHTRRHFAV